MTTDNIKQQDILYTNINIWIYFFLIGTPHEPLPLLVALPLKKITFFAASLLLLAEQGLQHCQESTGGLTQKRGDISTNTISI